ncbi:MAG: hypothetical protein U1F43_25440 [Myxococcota bacterium]
MSSALQVTSNQLSDLGWPRILRAVADRAATDPGRDACLALRFLDDDAMKLALARVDELMKLAGRGSDVPLAGVYDIRPALDAARRGATLAPPDLVAVARTAGARRSPRGATSCTTPTSRRSSASSRVNFLTSASWPASWPRPSTRPARCGTTRAPSWPRRAPAW